VRNIAGTLELAAGAGEVEVQLRVADGQAQIDLRAAARGIAVEIVFRRVAGARQSCDRRAEAALGEIEVGRDDRLGFRHAIALQQAAHGTHADHVGGELSLQVASSLLRRARIEQDHLQQVAIGLARAHDPHWRDAQALLKDRFAHRGFAPRHHAAHVGVMRDVGDVGHDPAFGKHGRDDVDVRQV
jgi:hypothetical protein